MCQYYKEHYENYDTALENFLNLYGNNVELITEESQKYAEKGINYFIFDGSINNEISLSEQHDFFLRTKEENIEKNLDGYLGTILTDQLYTLQQELNTVEFDKNGYGY